MNLSEALNAALPELPKTRLSSKFAPRLDPELVVREDILDGMPSISILQRSTASFARFTPEQWQLVQMFDGVRTYEEISEATLETNGAAIPVSDLRGFADSVEQLGFWYKSPQEKNLAMGEKLAAHRCRRSHGGGFSLAHISFSGWDPDRYLTLLHNKIGSVLYSKWFTLFAIALFLFEATIFAAQWKTIGPDVHLYYQFTQKSFGDLIEFWMLFFILGFLHETAHGLTCKHYGGQVHSMGFLLLYLTPAFYCDVTEVWISATRAERLATIIAGIWTELVVCGVATVIWTNTLPGEWTHDFCYKIMLLTGVAVVVLNVNPLLKLDGYYFLTECIRIPDLKERGTSFVSACVQRYVFRMPAEIPMIAARRVPLIVAFTLASGAYSYMVLFTVIGFAHNVFAHWFAELSIIPATALGFVMFRSRLRTLRQFIMSWFHIRSENGFFRPTLLKVSLAGAALALLFVPVVRDREDAFFVIEPAHIARVHSEMPSLVTAVYVGEGQYVHRGDLLGRSASLEEASASAESRASLTATQQQVFQAEVEHSGIGEALAANRGAERSKSISQEFHDKLGLIAPISGTVLTPQTGSLLNHVAAAGETLLEVADTSRLVARIFLPGPQMNHIRPGDEIALMLPSRFAEVRARLTAPQGPATDLPEGVLDEQQFAGSKLGSYYVSVVPLDRARDNVSTYVQPGMSGRVKVFGARRSFAARLAIVIFNFVHAHFW